MRTARILAAILLAGLVSGCGQPPAEPKTGRALPTPSAWTVRQSDTQIVLAGPNRVKLTFARHGAYLLGLQEAEVAGVALTHSRTIQRPVIAQEYDPDRWIFPAMLLRDVRVRGDRVEIRCDLVAFADEAAFRREFVFGGNRAKALADPLPAELAALRGKALQAEKAFDAAMANNARIASLADRVANDEKALAQADDRAAKSRATSALRKSRARLAAARVAQRQKLAADDKALTRRLADIARFEQAVRDRSLRFGDIHRDAYEFAQLRRPAETCDIDGLRRWLDRHGRQGRPGGQLTWIIEPSMHNIAGWPWAGWKQRFRFELPDGRRVTSLRVVGTWEVGGSAVGVTAVSLRYRGLGRIEQTFTPRNGDPSAGVAEAWNTVDGLPFLRNSRPVVSPKIVDVPANPALAPSLRQRAASWICRPARGAGTSFVDFQFRPAGAWCSFPDRQGSLRAVSEAYPGDDVISQTDEELFALSQEHETAWQHYLALAAGTGQLRLHDARTRWKEVDEFVRRRVSRELGFRRPIVRPAAGYLLEVEIPKNLAGIADRANALARQNVRMLVIHNPGWVNDRFPDGNERTGGGGICSVYDWRPTSDAAGPWKRMYDALHRDGIAYYAWVTGMTWGESPFVRAVGADPKHWAINRPDAKTSSGYEGHRNHNILDPRCRTLLLQRLARTRRACGYDGFWGDSFQNLFMSTLDWANGTGAPLQRAWWEQIARWSREGIGWMAESHAFPGLSCSIEVEGWEKDLWYFPHVCRWYRVHSQDAYTPAQRTETLFRAMANGGWTAPDLVPPVEAPWLKRPGRDAQRLPDDIIPRFSRFAADLLAARKLMRRPYVLAGGDGVLWLGKSDDEGVWFCFRAQAVPGGLAAQPITGGPAVRRAEPLHTYRVTGPKLPAAFGLARGPLADPRTRR